MSKDIPEIDDLTRGINDSELLLTQDTGGTQVEQREHTTSRIWMKYSVTAAGTGSSTAVSLMWP